MRLRLAMLLVVVVLPAASDDQLFENRVRPLFVSKCGACHNADLRSGELDLSTREGFLKGGSRGSLVSSGSPAESLLLRALRHEGELAMPPTGKLPQGEIRVVEEWVMTGANWPASAGKKAEEKHWSFQPLRESTSGQGIDEIIAAKLRAAGVKAAPRADRLTLLRRASFDLTGLPPTPEGIEAFLADARPDAFERVVERLLASPRYGEHWGRHWLDVARYADSTGADEDHRYPHAWRYRDYVIRAFNDDKPYDRFVREQIAGDLLPPYDPQETVNVEGIVATGFLALGPKLIAEIDKLKMFYDSVDEQIEITSKAFLGLTLSCARCHDHKFDPLTMKDYYAMASIFASTKNWAKVEGSPVVSTLYERPLVPAEQERAYEQVVRAIDEKKEEIKEVLADAGRRYRDERMHLLAGSMLAAHEVYEKGLDVEQVAKVHQLEPDVLQRWVDYLKPTRERRPQLEPWYEAVTPEQRLTVAADYQSRFIATAAERDAVLEAWKGEANAAQARGGEPPPKPRFFAGDDRFFAQVSAGPYGLPEENRDQHLLPATRELLAKLQGDQEQLEESVGDTPLANAVNEGDIVEQHVFLRGDPRQEGNVVPKRFPTVLAGNEQSPIKAGSGRLELSDWIASPDNPLTARVMVNRIWLWHFGDGLVATPNNFGRLGELPTHPELLDYLAAEFIRSGWSIKQMHRLIMSSDTYQMRSVPAAAQIEKDPDNQLLSRFRSRRLAVEEIRDGLLSLDGSLDTEMFGPLAQGEGTDKEFSEDRRSLHPDQTRRRTIYLPLRRSNLPTLLSLFDFGDAVTSNPQRGSTNVAPQALYMMNSDFIEERADAIARLLLEKQALDDRARFALGHLLVLNRPATERWLGAATDYLDGFPSEDRKQAWTSLCRTLIASNDFLYLH